MTYEELNSGFIIEQVGRPKGGQHHNGPTYYPIKITHPDFDSIIIQVGGYRNGTISNLNLGKKLFIEAIESIHKIKIEQ